MKSAFTIIGLLTIVSLYYVNECMLEENKAWEKFSKDHNCKVVEVKQGQTIIGSTLGSDGNIHINEHVYSGSGMLFLRRRQTILER